MYDARPIGGTHAPRTRRLALGGGPGDARGPVRRRYPRARGRPGCRRVHTPRRPAAPRPLHRGLLHPRRGSPAGREHGAVPDALVAVAPRPLGCRLAPVGPCSRQRPSSPSSSSSATGRGATTNGVIAARCWRFSARGSDRRRDRPERFAGTRSSERQLPRCRGFEAGRRRPESARYSSGPTWRSRSASFFPCIPPTLAHRLSAVVRLVGRAGPASRRRHRQRRRVRVPVPCSVDTRVFRGVDVRPGSRRRCPLSNSGHRPPVRVSASPDTSGSKPASRVPVGFAPRRSAPASVAADRQRRTPPRAAPLHRLR